MTKTAEAFRTISEVADELNVPKHVLRFWEGRFPQIKPMKRGGGRRYYRPEDMDLLRGICQLLHAEGYTIKGVQKILREQGVDTVKAAGLGPEPEAEVAVAVASVEDAPEPTAKRSRLKRLRTGRHAQAAAAKSPAREQILAVIAELENCRSLLLGEAVETSERRAQPQARRSARA